MNNKRIFSKYLLVLVFVLVMLFFLSFSVGRYPISPIELIQVIYSKITGDSHIVSSTAQVVVMNIRMPRIILAMLVGAALSAAGACYQGIFQNTMASPDILGASSGAAFGAALAIILHLGSIWITCFAFLFSLGTVLSVLFISKRIRGKQVVGIILAGIMMSNLISAGTSFLKLVADPADELPAITYWLMGGLSNGDMKDVTFLLPLLFIGLLPMFIYRWKMNVLSVGDDVAQTMGVNARNLRMIIILSATLLTSASVSVSGTIGWVGLVIPNMCRKVVGNDYRFLLITSMISGAIFLLIIDTLSRTMFATELPLSILTGFIGAPFFLYLMTKKGDRL